MVKDIRLIQKLWKCWFNNHQIAITKEEKIRVKKIQRLLEILIVNERELTDEEIQFLKTLEKDKYFKV